VQHGKSFVSIPKGEDPMSITMERAIELIEEKKIADANKIIKIFEEDENVQLLNGRWGPYLKIGKNNFKLPKNIEAEKLTLEECLKIAEEQGTAKGKAKTKKTTTKKTTKK